MRIFLILIILFPFISTGQISDDFSDGDFTTAPGWTGNVAKFKINSFNQLQLNDSIAGKSYLSLANPMGSLDNMEWRFYISQNFSSSGTNYGRVYLSSNQSNLDTSLNGYFLQFGEGGARDAVELFRQENKVITSIARGADSLIANAFEITVKVTRDNTGLWKLFIDPRAGNNFQIQASGMDDTISTSSYFGVFCNYTSSNGTKFYFDNFYAGPILIDTASPLIESITVVSNTQLDVYFNESLDKNTAENNANYAVNNSVGHPLSATLDASKPQLVHLNFPVAFTDGIENTLEISHIKDLSNNVISTISTKYIYYAEVIPEYKDIIISEIFADPTPSLGLPSTEFIEIFNRSSKNLNLKDWKFMDKSSTGNLKSLILLPQQYLILCPAVDSVLLAPFGKTMGLKTFPTLNNSGDNIYLKDNKGTIIDSVIYSDAWYRDEIKKDGGWTLELINPLSSGSNCDISGNWIASRDALGGSPGNQNTVFDIIKDIEAPVITEITVADLTHLQICFSEMPDTTGLNRVGNYSLDNTVGTPDSVILISGTNCIMLVFTSGINKPDYILTINHLSDCAGNSSSFIHEPFSIYIPHSYDVVINEIMADPDPSVGLPAYEYVELFNTKSFPINLNNWSLSVGTNTKKISPAVILPDSFLVLTSPMAIKAFDSSIAILAITGLPAFINTGQTLTLRTLTGAIISSVTYSNDWYQDETKNQGGWSLEQMDPSNPCGGMNNWRATVNYNGGTPGARNSIYTSNPDQAAPELLRANVINQDSIELFFNESLDSTNALNPTLYSIDNDIGFAKHVYPVAPDFKKAGIKLSAPLQQGIIYTLTAGNTIRDCEGNTIASKNLVRFALPEQAMPHDIVINEILFDPNNDGVDFIEIFNGSNKVIDLNKLMLASYDTIANIITSVHSISTEVYLIFPEEYLVLSSKSTAVKNQYYTTNPNGFLDLPSMPAMNISGGSIAISDTSGLVVDHLTYNAAMQFPLLNATKGISLERIDYIRDTQDKSNWHSAAESVGFATPAYENSQHYSFSESNNKLTLAPEIFSPDNDGNNDILSINYSFDKPGMIGNVSVYDSKGRQVKQLIKNELLATKGIFSWDGINSNNEKAIIGIYIIYFEAFNLDGSVEKFKKTCVLGRTL